MTVDLAVVAEELLGLSPRPRDAEVATANIERWLVGDEYAEYRPLLEAMIAQGDWDGLLDSFYRVLPFGTGGRRGPVGIGPNRMNPWSLGTSVQGNIAFLKERFGAEAKLSVVIAADVRVFRDLREAFPSGVENPLLGMRSVDLASQAAAIYVANGLDVHMLAPESGRFLATPELSFLIRRLGAQGGLNVSASHNHPDDTGGKFYTEHGAQEVPPHDERMVEHVQAVTEVQSMPWQEAIDTGRVHFLGPEHHEAYLEDAMTVLKGQSRSARIVFTNLHGVGDMSVGEALERSGFEVHYVASQRAHDGLFPAVRFRAPNPEYPSALEQAIDLGRELDADLVLATDPDADRIGAVVPDPDSGPGAWRFLTGNELSCLVAAARFEGAAPGCIGIKTEVTTSLFSRVVEAAGGQVVGHLLVGCKYIAGVMRALETEGHFEGVRGSLSDVLIGTEESHGFLLSTNIRDKDGAAPALVIAELASRQKDAGSSLLHYLERIYRRHGAVANVQMPVVMAGAVGRGRIEAIQAALRIKPPTELGGRTVTAFHDRRDEQGVFGPVVSETDRSARDVLVFELGPDHRLVIRPSGTEPKTKIYAEVIVPVDGDVREALAGAEAEAQALAVDFVGRALAEVDISLTAPALHCSPLLGVDERQAFGDSVLPQAIDQALSGTSASDIRCWLEERIGPWGGDGIGLTAPGYQHWRSSVEAEGLQAPSALVALDEAWTPR